MQTTDSRFLFTKNKIVVDCFFFKEKPRELNQWNVYSSFVLLTFHISNFFDEAVKFVLKCGGVTTSVVIARWPPTEVLGHEAFGTKPLCII